jgi:DNA repair exonuclease SbcCD ATPase subunit
MLNFITRNNIKDMAGLDDCFRNIVGKQQDIRDKLKPIDRRLKTLDEHIKQSGAYKAHRKHKAQYEKLYAEYTTINKAGGFGSERKAQKALAAANEYHETYRNEITMFEAAEKYLKGVLQKHYDPKKLPPISKWQAEIAKLTAERKRIEADYYKLRDEVKEAEQIRKSIYNTIRQEQRETQPRRAQGIDL